MAYTVFKNDEEPAISEETLNRMQKELLKLVFPIRLNLYNTKYY